MELSLDNLKINTDHKHLQVNENHEGLQLDPNILNSIDDILESYEKKKIVNLDDLDEEITALIRSKAALQTDMDQKIAEIARKEESRNREEDIGRSSIFITGIRGYSGYTGLHGITGTGGSWGFQGATGTMSYGGVTGTRGQGLTGTKLESHCTDYTEKTSDGFTVRCRVGKPRPRSGNMGID